MSTMFHVIPQNTSNISSSINETLSKMDVDLNINLDYGELLLCKMVLEGRRQETLDQSFVPFGTGQQGIPVILSELILLDGFDPMSLSFTVRDVTTELSGVRLTFCTDPLQMRSLYHEDVLKVNEGNDLLLSCRVRGRPTPLISWYINQTEIKNPWRLETGRGIIQKSRISKTLFIVTIVQSVRRMNKENDINNSNNK
ncbi:unnamed protein product [Schistosoma margrebowiei]|uniref:Ig-like domain-containing protein n=1 Tax=Schistosoma margrebowiei TaxID=48269 RepID=A0A3P7W1S6_9TREM|nr:unnamed protein product [Schistosoma margrebowiei]